MSNKKASTKRADQQVPVSTSPYPVRTGNDFSKGVQSIRRVVENFSRVEKQRRDDGEMRV